MIIEQFLEEFNDDQILLRLDSEVRDYVISGKIGLEKIPTTDNVADGMTDYYLADRYRSLRHQMVVMKYQSD